MGFGQGCCPTSLCMDSAQGGNLRPSSGSLDIPLGRVQAARFQTSQVIGIKNVGRYCGFGQVIALMCLHKIVATRLSRGRPFLQTPI